MQVIKTLLLGVGNIGAFYDIDDPSVQPRSHCKAVLENNHFEIAAIIDPDKTKTEKVQNHYNISPDIFYNALDDLPQGLQIDMAIFAAPPHGRLEDFKRLQEHGIKFCVFEKPFACSFKEAQELEGVCKHNSIQALVNFHRRYDERLLSFKEQLPKGETPEKIVVHYTKGIKNYGSHAIDLLMDYFGDVAAVQALSASDADDPLIDGVLHFENGVIAHFIGHDTGYDLFEFEFFYKDKKFTLAQGTTQQWVQQSRENLVYEGYSHLGDFEFISAPQKVSGMLGLYQDISCYLNDPKHILKGCDLQQAKKGMVIIENLLKSASDKRFIEI